MAKDDRSGEFVGVLGFFIAICTILVGLRCYCKLVLVKNFAADDYFSVLTLVAFLFFCTLALLGVQNGTGKRVWLTPPADYVNGMKWWWSCEPTYVLANISLKMSIGIFLLRIAVERVHRIILWTALISIQLYSVFFFFIFTFQCWPVSYFWEQYRGGKGRCMPTTVVVSTFYGYSALSCVTDWIFSTVPIFIVKDLQMNQKKKITVGFLLAFCAIGSTATIVRLPFIKGLNDTGDFLYATIDVAIWSTCETGIGLAASAIATLRPLLRQVLGDTTNGASEQKRSHAWGGPSRSGYMAHSSSKAGDPDIALDTQSSKNPHIRIANSRDLSPSNSTAGLRDWELEKDSRTKSPGLGSPDGGITRTIHIQQS
ncbi:hypothetical protein DE146DRAFT_162211 [Phaeosphaeria sp. MPI-PUGE-AT-0046c]|nr:hypothetical protein DE146DRAFT_162211 [Phaeosphaeria sp. MPI-PUGE-AT-0046c]